MPVKVDVKKISLVSLFDIYMFTNLQRKHICILIRQLNND